MFLLWRLRRAGRRIVATEIRTGPGHGFGHKDKRGRGQSYNWSMFGLPRPIGPVNDMLRYWYTSHSGRRGDESAA